MSTLVRDGALEFLQDQAEKQAAEIESLTQDVIDLTVRAETAEAEVRRLKASYPELV